VLYSTEEVGIRVYHMLSFPTTMVGKRVGRWHHLRCYMVVDAEPRCIGMRLDNGRFLTRHIARAKRQVRMVRKNLQIAHSR
jgi:hypothetical protein